MPSLRELQLRFAAALFDGAVMPAAELIEAAGIDPAARIGIYSNNLQAGFRKALALSFPVIEKLVGGGYFTQLALDYQREYPSRSGDLHHIAHSFSVFLEARFAAGEYGYLSDVARLEWACQEIAVAARQRAASVDDLGQLDPEQYESLPLALHPAVRLVESRYPIVRIWLSNQPGAAPEVIDLAAGGDRVLVCERAGELEFHRLSAVEYVLAAAAVRHCSLGEAVEQALIAAGDTPIDLTGVLRRLFSAQALVLPSIQGASP